MVDYNAIVERVTLFVLEDWGMMMPEVIGDAAFCASGDYFLAQMDFEGEQKFLGTIYILCQRGFTETLARNLLGASEDEITNEQAIDALGEMANIFTGHFVTEVFGVDEPFMLHAPTAMTADPAAVQAFLARKPLGFLGDDEPVAIAWEIPEKKKR